MTYKDGDYIVFNRQKTEYTELTIEWCAEENKLKVEVRSKEKDRELKAYIFFLNDYDLKYLQSVLNKKLEKRKNNDEC